MSKRAAGRGFKPRPRLHDPNRTGGLFLFSVIASSECGFTARMRLRSTHRSSTISPQRAATGPYSQRKQSGRKRSSPESTLSDRFHRYNRYVGTQLHLNLTFLYRHLRFMFLLYHLTSPLIISVIRICFWNKASIGFRVFKAMQWK